MPITNYTRGISQEDQSLLDKFFYSESENIIGTTASFQSGLNSFKIGGQHTMQSGGQNIYITNESSDIDFYPSWSGLLNPANPDNHGDDGIIPMTDRVHTSDMITFSASTPDTSGGVEAVATYTNTINASVFGVSFIIEEELPAGSTILYKVESPTQSIYSQLYDVTQALSIGHTVEDWFFNHPLDGLAGDVITESILVLTSSTENKSIESIIFGKK